MPNAPSTRYELKNRYDKKFFVHFYRSDDPKRLVFVQHGFSGSVDQLQIQVIIGAYLANGYNVAAIDCTNSFNEADGALENATIEHHLQDLEDAVQWAATQNWYQKPFSLLGTSLGGYACLLYAENHPAKILNLCGAAPVINGPLRGETHLRFNPESFREWKETGIKFKKSFRNGIHYEGRVPFTLFEALFKYDSLEKAHLLTMPVLLMVGEKDTSCPPECQQVLFDKLSGPKELKIIEEADHNYKPKIDEMAALLSDWLKRLA